MCILYLHNISVWTGHISSAQQAHLASGPVTNSTNLDVWEKQSKFQEKAEKD